MILRKVIMDVIWLFEKKLAFKGIQMLQLNKWCIYWVFQLIFFFYIVVLKYYFLILFCYNKVITFQYRFINCLIEQNLEKKKLTKYWVISFFFLFFFPFWREIHTNGFFSSGPNLSHSWFSPFAQPEKYITAREPKHFVSGIAHGLSAAG